MIIIINMYAMYNLPSSDSIPVVKETIPNYVKFAITTNKWITNWFFSFPFFHADIKQIRGICCCCGNKLYMHIYSYIYRVIIIEENAF